MEPLFVNSNVIKLNDKDFKIYKSGETQKIKKVILTNPEFKSNHGYIMVYASWCPHCRAKEDFWSYLADQFNKNSKYKNEHFRIGVINAEDPNSQGIVKVLDIGPIPKFLHVVPVNKYGGHGTLSDYQGDDLNPESLIREICDMSSTETLCHFDSKLLNPPPIAY